jgi:hypothetical protein
VVSAAVLSTGVTVIAGRAVTSGATIKIEVNIIMIVINAKILFFDNLLSK